MQVIAWMKPAFQIEIKGIKTNMGKKMMRLTLMVLFVFVIVGMFRASQSDKITVNTDEGLQPEPIHPRVEQIVYWVLSKSHYQRKDVNDSLSSQFYDNYLDLLDYQRYYFLKSDIDKFEHYRYNFDDAIRTGDLNYAYEIFNIFLKRFEDRNQKIKALVENEFTYTTDEYFNADRSKSPWEETTAGLDSLWKLRIKNEALNLKLAGKDWPGVQKTIINRYNNFETRMRQTQSEDVFQLYMNAFAETFDPHTNYLSPKTSDDFKIRMSLSLEGIGATLRNEDEYTKVVDIVPGGPADKSSLLHANDLITAVGQGEDGELVDILGWRVDDVVQLIRGSKGTKVRLQIIKAGSSLSAPQDTIMITRDKVKLADRAAKADTLHVTNDGRKYTIGVIEIPDFYFDFENMRSGDTSYASTSRDVHRLIRDLQSKHVEGIIIDLRNNGGGFLNEAIELTGLFINRGAVVLVRDAEGRTKVERDPDPGIAYEGPVAVLVDRLSASASEIFAAAIQDYGRGIIVGEQTYGKGTVQNMIQLNRFLPSSDQKLGQIKMTIAKFYRINGGSTQHVGVIPDIVLPSRYNAMDIGESNEKNALLWDEIDATPFQPFSTTLNSEIPRLRERHKLRIDANPEFQAMVEEIHEIEESREEKLISLNEEIRKKQRDEADAKKILHKKDQDEKDTDLFLAETASVLSDWITISHSK
jgi:carboxyl-terminal processing protease